MLNQPIIPSGWVLCSALLKVSFLKLSSQYRLRNIFSYCSRVFFFLSVDNFAGSRGRSFGTYDGGSDDHCAVVSRSGWWHSEESCQNPVVGNPNSAFSDGAIYWKTHFNRPPIRLRAIQMKLRRRQLRSKQEQLSDSAVSTKRTIYRSPIQLLTKYF